MKHNTVSIKRTFSWLLSFCKQTASPAYTASFSRTLQSDWAAHVHVYTFIQPVHGIFQVFIFSSSLLQDFSALTIDTVGWALGKAAGP